MSSLYRQGSHRQTLMPMDRHALSIAPEKAVIASDQVLSEALRQDHCPSTPHVTRTRSQLALGRHGDRSRLIAFRGSAVIVPRSSQPTSTSPKAVPPLSVRDSLVDRSSEDDAETQAAGQFIRQPELESNTRFVPENELLRHEHDGIQGTISRARPSAHLPRLPPLVPRIGGQFALDGNSARLSRPSTHRSVPNLHSARVSSGQVTCSARDFGPGRARPASWREPSQPSLRKPSQSSLCEPIQSSPVRVFAPSRELPPDDEDATATLLAELLPED